MPEPLSGLEQLLQVVGSLKNCHLKNLIEVKPSLTADDIQLIASRSHIHRITADGTILPRRAILETGKQRQMGWLIMVGESFPEELTYNEAGQPIVPQELTYWWRAETSPFYQILEPNTEVYFENTDKASVIPAWGEAI